jgi:PAS domain S-box-containing protein
MLALIVDHLPHPTYWKDQNGTFCGCNPAFAAAIGLQHPAEIVGIEQDLPLLQGMNFGSDRDLAVIANNAPERYFTQRSTSTGTTHLAIYKTPLYSADQQVVGMLCSIEDISAYSLLIDEQLSSHQTDRASELAEAITCLEAEIMERQQIESLLRASEAYQRKLFDSSPIGLALSTPDGKLVEVNPAYAAILGRTVPETVNLTNQDITPETYDAAEQALLHSLYKTGRYGPYEKEYIHKQGHLVPVRLSGILVERDDEQYIWSCAEEISDRIETEAKLRESRQLLQSVIDNIPQAIFWNDLYSVYLGCNRKFAQDANLANSDAVIGKTDYNLPWTEAEATHNHEYDRQVIESGIPRLNIEETLYQPDGQHWVNTNKIPLHDAEGSVVGVLGTYEDITDRKRAEETLRRSEQQLREQAKRERILNRLTRKISSSLDFNLILSTTLQELRHSLQVDHCAFAWYRTNTKKPHWEVTAEAHEATITPLKGRYPVTIVGALGEQLLNQQTLKVADITQLEDVNWQRLARSLKFQAALVVPLKLPAGTTGIICALQYNQSHGWSEHEIELVQAVMEQLAIALNQAQLYDQARTKAHELEVTLQELRQTQAKMVQSEKMSSLGQLVAGVAHEINNPVNFIYGNLNHAREYTNALLHLIQLYQKHHATPHPDIQVEIEDIDLEFLLEDLPKLLNSMQTGADRIQKIVLSLRNFSRMDESEQKAVNIHEGIESTLIILQNRLKPKAGKATITVIKQFGQLPPVNCYPGQLNQVFMNILSNAMDALEEMESRKQETGDRRQGIGNREQGTGNREQGTEEMRETRETEGERGGVPSPPLPITPSTPTITISTELVDRDRIQIRIADNGPGISKEQQRRLFDPFFTTKAIGRGTGLGLSISYQVIVEKHGGSLTCLSEPGQGAEFLIEIPTKVPVG